MVLLYRRWSVGGSACGAAHPNPTAATIGACRTPVKPPPGTPPAEPSASICTPSARAIDAVAWIADIHHLHLKRRADLPWRPEDVAATVVLISTNKIWTSYGPTIAQDKSRARYRF